MHALARALVRSVNGNYAGLREVIREQLTLRAAEAIEYVRPVVVESMVSSKNCDAITKMSVEGLPKGTEIDEKLPKAKAGKRRADQ